MRWGGTSHQQAPFTRLRVHYTLDPGPKTLQDLTHSVDADAAGQVLLHHMS